MRKWHKVAKAAWYLIAITAGVLLFLAGQNLGVEPTWRVLVGAVMATASLTIVPTFWFRVLSYVRSDEFGKRNVKELVFYLVGGVAASFVLITILGLHPIFGVIGGFAVTLFGWHVILSDYDDDTQTPQ